MNLLSSDFESSVKSLNRNDLYLQIQRKKRELEKLERNSSNFAALSQEIYYMWSIQREKMWDIEETTIMDQKNYIVPNSYDVLLSDVNHELLLGDVSERLGIQYLSTPTQEQLTYELNRPSITGILFGENIRPMVNLIVSIKPYFKKRNITFLLDTGSPHLYLCEQALTELGFVENIPKTFDLIFRDKSYAASVSPIVLPDGRTGNFKDINLLGSNFLKVSNGVVLINYPDNELTITFE